MLATLLLAGITLLEIPIDEPVLAVRIADVDADGEEEIVAVTATALLVIERDGTVRRHAPTPLALVGRGLLARSTPAGLADLAGKRLGPTPLLGKLGAGDPALLLSPGDLDGDGRDDPIYGTLDGVVTPGGVVPVLPRASLGIRNAEAFAIQYTMPIPVIGNWSGAGRELVLFDENTLRAFHGSKEVARLELPLQEFAKSAEGLRRNEVFVQDIDGDKRLDLMLVMARGSLKVFAEFEVNVWQFRGGRIYDEKRKGFYRPATVIKVSGALLGARLLDCDGDGDLDLALATISTSILAAATGQYLVFRCEQGKLERKPTWQYQGLVPISSLKREPDPPATILPDLNGDGRPELAVRGLGVRIYSATNAGKFVEAARQRGEFAAPIAGKKMAVLIGKKGLLVVR